MGKPRALYKGVFLLFLLVVGIRLVLDVVFFLYFGPHAVNQVELWLYYGVAGGYHQTASRGGDPTAWLLRFIGTFLQGDALFYFLPLLSAILVGVTSALICLLVREFIDGETAYYSGLIYGFMVEPLSLSLVGFTHDHLLTPLVLATILLAIRALREGKTVSRLASSVSALALFYLSTRINVGAYVAAGVFAIYVASLVVRRAPKYFPHYTAALFVGFLIAGLCVLPGIIEYELGKTPQGRMGSADVKPITPSNFWLRYNVLLLLLPFGLYVAYGRREYISVSYAAFGFMFALSMDRGTRVSDIGVAMLAAYALLGWKNQWGVYIPYLAALFVGLTCIIPLPLEYSAPIILAAAAFAYLLRQKHKVKGTIMLLLALGVVLTLAGMLVSTKKVIPDAEYGLYATTVRHLDKEKVLVSWDRGYMLEALSGKKSVSTAGRITYAAHEALWLPEAQSHAVLKALGVDYIVFLDTQFRKVLYDGQSGYLLEGGMVFTPKSIPSSAVSNYLTAYRLSNAVADPRYFRLIAEANDKKLGGRYMVYGLDEVAANGSIVSMVAYNNEPEIERAIVDLTVVGYTNGNETAPKPSAKKLGDYVNLGYCLTCALKVIAAVLGVAVYALFVLSLQKAGAGKRGRRRLTYAFACLALLAFLFVLSMIFPQTPAPQSAPNGTARAVETFTWSYNVSFEPNMSLVTLNLGETIEVVNCSAAIRGDRPSGYAGFVTFKNVCRRVDERARVLLVDTTASAKAGQMVVEDYVEADLNLDENAETRVDYSFNRMYPDHQYVIGYFKGNCIKTVAEKSRDAMGEGVEVSYLFCSPNDYQTIANVSYGVNGRPMIYRL